MEVMIALMILSVIGAVTAFQMKKMLDNHRFESEVSDLFIGLQEAQVLSATYQTDLALDIFLKEGKLTYQITSDEPFPPRVLSAKTASLAHTKWIKFGDKKVSQLHFDIYSGGRVEPRGSLAFCQAEEGAKALWFDLQHGHLLKFAYRKPPSLKRPILTKPNSNL